MAVPKLLNSFVDALYLKKYFGRWSDRWTIFRVWLALWACCLTWIINPSARKAAGFLPLILAFIKFPSDPTPIYLTQTALGGIVVCAVWGWSVLAMKLSLLARDAAKDQMTYATVNQTIFKENPDMQPAQIEGRFLEQVFTGIFLQAGSSAIYAVFLFIGIYFVFLIRAFVPRLFFIMVFGSILLCIYATIGPLLPIWYAVELGQIFMIPYGYYLAITIACSIFVVPQSVSHSITEKLHAQTSLIKEALQLSPERLRNMDDNQVAAAIAEWDNTRNEIIQQADLTTLQTGFLAKEISMQKASGKDVQKLVELVKMMRFCLSGQSIFIRHVHRRAKASAGSTRSDGGEKTPVAQASQTSVESLPYASAPALKDLLASVAASSDRQVRSLQRGMEAFTNFLDRETGMSHAFSGIFKQPPVVTEELEAALADLKQAIAEAAEPRGEKSSADKPNSSRASYLHEVWQLFLCTFSSELETALEFVLEIEKRPVKLWFPGRQNGPAEDDVTKAHAVPRAMRRRIEMTLGGDAVLPFEEDIPERIEGVSTLELGKESTMSDRERRRSSALNIIQRIYAAIDWFFTSVESTFSLKVGILAICLAVPAWIYDNGSAEFYYREKGLWALISGVTAKGLFSGETTFGFIQRLLGVIIGGVVALAMWYISAGSGHGNAYGLAAVFAVSLALFIPWRIWNPNFLTHITATTSGALIIGYSWYDRPDSPVPEIWGPGQGWEVFWRRELLVLVGITAAWIIDLFPRPKPGRDHVRRIYSRTISELGNIGALVIRVLHNPPKNVAEVNMYEQRWSELRAISSKLRMTSVRLLLAKLEPDINKKWNPERYAMLQKLQYDAIDLLAILAFVCEGLNPATRTSTIASGAFSSARVAAALNLMSIVSSGLATERPLPAILPSPRNPSREYPDLDSEVTDALNKATDTTGGFDRTAFILAEGTLLELGSIAEQMAVEAQALFGTNMSWT
ncbi:hypothetical protein M407DRAFT_24334 [Tulasnella calospora MUT 4182]|uniref:ER transporter 6TM N-terminal domain-containing protein n=1 Tax=Tulasnella calospora MUT 4182 TaxID=1051891 RepID=A0A0C3KYC8_9AGAM|nr:hypothetical protein M407DRAFT_24334 [Tulasnella calospora MUT 4182]